MTLEDFFTLTEMKDGLTAPSRVEELVTFMWKEKHSDTVKNIGDATRQWGAVASTIAATDSKDCLDLFIKLDGLCFIDRWLKDALKFSAETSDGLVEESLTALLRAVEKLHIGNERSIASGISMTVNNLLNHKSSQVQDRAKVLFDSWKEGTVDNEVHIVGEFNLSLPDSEIVKPVCVDVDNSVSQGNGNGENNSAETTRSDALVSSAVNCLKQEVAEDRYIPTHNQDPCSNVTCDQKKVEVRSPNLLASSVQESTSVKETSPTGTIEGTTADDSKQGTAEVQPEVSKSNEISNDEMPVLKLNTVPEKSSTRASFSSATGGGEVSCSNDLATAQHVVTEPTSQINIDDVGDVRTPASVTKVGIDDSAHILNTDGECGSDGFQDLSTTECRFGKSEHLDTSFSRMEDDGVSEEAKEHSSNDEDENVRNFSENSRSRTHARSPDMIDDNDERGSDMELEYGIVDALEVARQVARAVEREVVDYREHSCSSSMEKTTEECSRKPGSPDPLDGEQELPAEIPHRDMPTGQICPAEAYPKDERLANNNLDNLCSELGRDKYDVETSHVTEAAQESEVSTGKVLCDFDLNQEVDSDETEHIANPILAPISVPASMPIAASGSSVALFQFEGNLGWKGSAATSAFHPASPRRISNKKILPPGGTSSGFSRRQFFPEFDLNVADGGDDKIPGSSAIHTAESCLEASPIISERHKLDLNLTSDDGDAPPSDFRIERRLCHNRNGHRSMSPASSSSSVQPSARNFDLNDRPYLLNDSNSDQELFLGKSSQSSSAYGGPKPDDPVISIMGTRVEVSGKNFMPQTRSLPNGKDLDTARDSITARDGGILGMAPTVSYTQSNVFGYNGLTAAPMMSFSSPMYGPGSGGSFPYMVDSRGTPVVPQVMGSASAVPPFSHAPLWLSPMNGVVPPRPNFDLNSGFTVEGANRNSGVFRQFLMPVQSRPMEEHLWTTSEPSSSSGVGGKRKEPDGGLEPFPFNYRNQQPRWR